MSRALPDDNLVEGASYRVSLLNPHKPGNLSEGQKLTHTIVNIPVFDLQINKLKEKKPDLDVDFTIVWVNSMADYPFLAWPNVSKATNKIIGKTGGSVKTTELTTEGVEPEKTLLDKLPNPFATFGSAVKWVGIGAFVLLLIGILAFSGAAKNIKSVNVGAA